MKILRCSRISSRQTMLCLLIAILCVTAPQVCVAQNNIANTTAQPAATAQTVYEAGDIYVPGSRVYIFVGKTGFGHEHGVVGQLKQGHIGMMAGKSAGNLDFDMATFTADTPEARKFVRLEGTTDVSTQQQVNANMRGPDVLDVSRFPIARFVIKEVAKLPQPAKSGLPQYRLDGDFTLHGTTRPIQVVAEAEDQRGWIRLRGGFTMLQSQFGMKPFAKALGAVGVTDQLTVWGDLLIAKQRQVAPRPASQRQ